MRLISPFIKALGLLLFVIASTVHAEPVRSAGTEVELVSETTSARRGESLWVAVRMKMDPDWHIYWKNPGDSGLAPTIKWDLPQDVRAGSIRWPYPHRIEVPPLVMYGYEGEIFLITRIGVPASFKEPSLTVKARANWLACRIQCVPGEADLTLTLPISANPPSRNSQWAPAFDETRKLWPKTDARWEISAVDEDGSYVLEFRSPPGEDLLQGAYFFPERDDVIEHSAKEVFERHGRRYTLRLQKSELNLDPVLSLEGNLVLHHEGGTPDEALEVEARLVLSPAAPVKGRGPTGLYGPSVSLIAACLLALIGGIILNLMPCVLPVLSVKVLKLVESTHGHRTVAIRHGLAFASGVVAAFWVLAGVMVALKSLGEDIGWGFQFQSPVFLIALSVLFYVLALNFFGVFEIGTSIAGAAQKRHKHFASVSSSFGNGVLATIVATPCTAPFMGTAIGAALSQSTLGVILIFTFMGLGMALPFVLLAVFPSLLAWVPKPGPWMIRFKQVLGLFLFATVVWLASVLALVAGTMAVVQLYTGLIVIGFFLWRWGRQPVSLVVTILVMTLIAGGLNGLMLKIYRGKGTDVWQTFSKDRVTALRSQGRTVFVDFTAAWCLTCQVNKKSTLNTKEVMEAFEKNNIALLRADWTRRDDRISQALAEMGRNSIPVYVLYPPGLDSEPIFLPELITPKIVIQALENMKKGDQR